MFKWVKILLRILGRKQKTLSILKGSLSMAKYTVTTPPAYSGNQYGYSPTNNISDVVGWQNNPEFTNLQDGSYWFFAIYALNGSVYRTSSAITVSFGCVGLPTGAVSATMVNCGTATADLTIANSTTATKVGFSSGSSYSGANYASALAVSALTGSPKVITSVPNPASGSQPYTVRLYKGGQNCFSDQTVSVVHANCVSFNQVGDMMYMEGGGIKVGISTLFGGAIYHISKGGSTKNWVNNYPTGRAGFISFYGDPEPYNHPPNVAYPFYSAASWNPVHDGDAGNNPSPVIGTPEILSGDTFYIKSNPMQWKFVDGLVETEVVNECWYTLIPSRNAVHVKGRSTVNRASGGFSGTGKASETPYIYLTRDLEIPKTYDGINPFTNAPTVSPPFAYGSFPNVQAIVGGSNPVPSEKWTAMLNSDGEGVGMYYPDASLYVMSKVGDTSGGVEYNSDSCSIIQHVSTYLDVQTYVKEWEFDLIVGNEAQIRQFAYDRHFGAI